MASRRRHGWAAHFRHPEEKHWRPVFRWDLRDYRTEEEALTAAMRFVGAKNEIPS